MHSGGVCDGLLCPGRRHHLQPGHPTGGPRQRPRQAPPTHPLRRARHRTPLVRHHHHRPSNSTASPLFICALPPSHRSRLTAMPPPCPLQVRLVRLQLWLCAQGGRSGHAVLPQHQRGGRGRHDHVDAHGQGQGTQGEADRQADRQAGRRRRGNTPTDRGGRRIDRLFRLCVCDACVFSPR